MAWCWDQVKDSRHFPWAKCPFTYKVLFLCSSSFVPFYQNALYLRSGSFILFHSFPNECNIVWFLEAVFKINICSLTPMHVQGDCRNYLESRWGHRGETELPSEYSCQDVAKAISIWPCILGSQLTLCEMRCVWGVACGKLSPSHLEGCTMGTLIFYGGMLTLM